MAIHVMQISGVRSQCSAKVGSEHRLVLCKERLNIQLKIKKQAITTEKLNTEPIYDDTIKRMYIFDRKQTK